MQCRIGGLHRKAVCVLWGMCLLLLPITSMPLVRMVARGATVNPAAVIPLVFLVILYLAPYILRNGYLPQESKILLTFVAASILASGLSLFLPLFPYKGQEPLERSLKALLTLATGASFYFTTVAIVRREGDLGWALRMINVGALVMMAWALLQGWYIVFHGGNFPGWMHIMHRAISIRDMNSQRVTGLSYEPSWLAHQLSVLYFPIWFGMLLNGRSLYRMRIVRLPVEAILIAVGLLLIFLGKSRIGLISFFVITGIVGVVLSWRFASRVFYFAKGKAARVLPRGGDALGGFAAAAVVLLIVAILLSSAVGAVYIASRLDWRMAKVFSPDFIDLLQSENAGLFSYPFARMLKFAERTAYWEGGYRVFEEYPILGVGLGNAGFLFWEKIPDYGLKAPEVVHAVRASTTIFPNPKNLWIRLLAETGIVGYVIYAVWVVVLLLRSLDLWHRRKGLLQAIGIMGVLSVAAIISEGFSLDTFGLPYSWIALGLVSSTARGEMIPKSWTVG